MLSFLNLLGLKADIKQKQFDTRIVLFGEVKIDGVTYSEFYSLDICPKCHRVLNERKARYDTLCCYYCGHTNDSLFDTDVVIVRDRFKDGVFVDTVVEKLLHDAD